MGSHGLTGARKLFFGSTTERVLRETPLPVLVTPPVDPGPVHIEGARALLRRIVGRSISRHRRYIRLGSRAVWLKRSPCRSFWFT